MEDIIRFKEKIPIGYTPKDFYDELIKVQRQFRSEECFNYIENNLLAQLEKDNLDYINNFQEIKKFRQYYTEHLVYEFIKRNKLNSISTPRQEFEFNSEEWFKPFEINKYNLPKSKTTFNKLNNNLTNGLSLTIQNIKIKNPLISDILSYSTIPGIFSYFLFENDNNIFINNLDSLTSIYRNSDSKNSPYYDYIKIFLNGVFKMPTFIHFLNKVMYSIFTPYLCNEKPFSKKEIPLILSEINDNAAENKSSCPQIIKDVIDILRYRHDDKEKNHYILCISIFKDCLFEPLRQEPTIFMCSDFPSYEINRDFQLNKGKYSERISENRVFRNFFNQLFSKSDEFDDFVFNFIWSIANKTNDSKTMMNLTMKYTYLYSFDKVLIESDKIDYDSVINDFKESYKKGSFLLYYYDNINKTESEESPLSASTMIQQNTLVFEFELLEMIKKAPILQPKSNIPQDRILDIVKEYLIDKSDPLSAGIGFYRFNRMFEIWDKVSGKFPTNKIELHNYFEKAMKKRRIESNVELIKQQFKLKGEFALKLKLSEKTMNNWKYYINNMIIKNLISAVFVDIRYSKRFFPRTYDIISDPAKNFKENLKILLNNILLFNKDSLNDYYQKFESIKDFELLLSGFYLNCNLKYYNFIFLKPELNESDENLNELICLHISKIIQLIIDRNPNIYNNTFGSSKSYFSEDVIKMRNAFDANVDPHRKIFLIQKCINHAIRKTENQFVQSENLELEHKLFIDLLLAFSNPRNLISNIIFMMNYENLNYVNSISSYFNHFLNIIWSDKSIFEYSEKMLSFYENYKFLLVEKKSRKNAKEKKILFVHDSEMKLSELLKIIIPNNSADLDWSGLDNGKQVEFDVKQKKVYVHCVFSVDVHDEKINPDEFDVIVLFFDAKKDPRRLNEISSKEFQASDALKIAICNTNSKRVNFKDYKNVFNHVFDFSNDKLTKK